jgi:membrane associated rhomboid family serine protease
MAFIMLVAASAGSRLGVAATRVVAPGRIRFLFSLTLLGGALAVALKQVAEGQEAMDNLSTAAGAVLLSASGAICLVLALLVAVNLRKKSGTSR